MVSGKCRPLGGLTDLQSETMETLFQIALDVLIVAGFWWARPQMTEMAQASLSSWERPQV